MQTQKKGDNTKKQIFTKELFGSILIVISVATLFILFTGNTVFGTVGGLIKEFIFGISGAVLSYSLLFFAATMGVLLIIGKFFKLRLKTTLLSITLFVLIVALCHALTMQTIGAKTTSSYADFIVQSYTAGKNGILNVTAGGAIFSILVYPLVKVLSYIGSYILLAIAIIAVGYFLAFDKINKLFTYFAKKSPEQNTPNTVKSPQTPSQNRTENTVNTSLNSQTIHPSVQIIQPTAQNTVGDYTNSSVQMENTDNKGLPNIIGDQYVSYSDLSSMGISTPSKKAAENKPKGHAYMRNGIFDADSYFNKRHLSNQNTSNVPSYQSMQQQPNSVFTEPTVRNIFEERLQNTNTVIAQMQSQEAPISYSTLYAREHEAARQSAIPKSMVTTGVVDGLSNGAWDSATKNNSTIQTKDRRIIWGSESESSRLVDYTMPGREIPVANDEQDRPINTANTATEQTGINFAKPLEDELFPTRNIETPINRMDKIDLHQEEIATNEAAFSECRQNQFDDTPHVEEQNWQEENACQSIFKEQEQGQALQEISPIDRQPNSANIEQEILLDSKKEQIMNTLQEDSADIDDIDLFDERPTNIATENTAVNLENTEQEQSFENIFDSEYTLPVEQDSNVVEALQHITQTTQQDNTLNSTFVQNIQDEPEQVADDRVYSSPKDYRGLMPNFLQPDLPEEKPKPKKRRRKYQSPSLELFDDIEGTITVSDEEKDRNSNTIIATLKGFNISAEILSITCGPAVTRYDIDIPGNIPTSKVFAYRNELAMRLQSSAGVNIQNNYSNGSISIEVPNKVRSTVGLKEILNDKNYKESCKKPGSLVFSLGKDIEGKVVYGDIAKMKHLLVAGATGTGKSVFLNSLIISLIAKYGPEDLRIILIDPKQVEFSIYSKLPHLMVNEIICEASKVINVLNWAITEMEKRYRLFKEKGKTVHVRDIDEYNNHLTEDEEKLPKIVLIIDEVADLMQQDKKNIEDRIQSLTQKSRAAGIHLVLATQRPSVNVITGVIKANLPSRVAFKVAQEIDSRTILDSQGAETLLGKGDMFYKLEDMTMPARVQASYLSSEEVQKVVEYVKDNNESDYDEEIVEFLNKTEQCENTTGDEDGDNIQSVYIDALDIAITTGQVSISMIQRKLSVGYNKAGRIIEWMEHMGYISAFDGAKARRILITREEFNAKYGDYTQ